MYVILVYDIGVERVDAVRLFLKQYLNWVQNSVFEGELTDSELLRIVEGIKARIEEAKDFIVIYRLASNKYLETTEIGTPRVDVGTIL